MCFAVIFADFAERLIVFAEKSPGVGGASEYHTAPNQVHFVYDLTNLSGISHFKSLLTTFEPFALLSPSFLSGVC
jgi:hypothetical protein